MGLLRELVPTAVQLAVLINPANPANTSATLTGVEAVARALGLQVQFFKASTSGEINSAFATLVRERSDALLVAGDGFLHQPARPVDRIVGAPCAACDLLDARFCGSWWIDGLWHQSDRCVSSDRCLRRANPQGRRPSQPPRRAADRLELVVNLKRRKLLDLDIPPTLLARADEVIE